MTPELMLRDADLALYTAKERGRARAEVFDPAVHTRAVDLLAIEQELQLALGRDELLPALPAAGRSPERSHRRGRGAAALAAS